MARDPKAAESGQGKASDANAGGGSRGGDDNERAACHGNGWSMGPAAFASAFPFTSSMLVEPLRAFMEVPAKWAAEVTETAARPAQERAVPSGGSTKEAWD